MTHAAVPRGKRERLRENLPLVGRVPAVEVPHPEQQCHMAGKLLCQLEMPPAVAVYAVAALAATRTCRRGTRCVARQTDVTANVFHTVQGYAT